MTIWHTLEPDDGILRVEIDCVDRPVNVLSRSALEDLQGIVKWIVDDRRITHGVLFTSRKAGTFIAGADVAELQQIQNREAALELSRFGQSVFSRLESLPMPTVALISGACLGGGLEFALACRYRIASDHPQTLLGLPEVNLGIVPAWGGTVRLPRLIGLIDALPLILAGRRLNAQQAFRKGIVHDVVPPEVLLSVGEQLLNRLHNQPRSRRSSSRILPPRKRAKLKGFLERRSLVSNFVCRRARQQVIEQSHGHYPAPEKAIQVIARGWKDEQAGFQAESAAVADLAGHPVARELMRLFFLSEQSKKIPEEFVSQMPSADLNQVAVIGAGTMGAGIAVLLARRGLSVRLKDLDSSALDRGFRQIGKQLDRDVRRKTISPLAATRILDRISPTTDYSGFGQSQLVIEAAVEELELKRTIFRELAERTGPETVLATNTSSLRLQDIARELPEPGRFVGLHFFNPPDRMPLIEVVRTDETSSRALSLTLSLVARLGKCRVVVRDCAGFLVNRLLAVFMNEAGYLMQRGADPLQIEHAAIAFGMPMGPLELTDLVGMEVATHVAHHLHQAYGDRMQAAPIWKRIRDEQASDPSFPHRMLTSTGKKNKKSLSPGVSRIIAEIRDVNSQEAYGVAELDEAELIERMIFPVINEAARCLDEKIVDQPATIDLAMVFGTGFAPFRGGPLRYADSVGLDGIQQRLTQWGQTEPRLLPSQAFRNFADRPGQFYDQGEQLGTTVPRGAARGL